MNSLTLCPGNPKRIKKAKLTSSPWAQEASFQRRSHVSFDLRNKLYGQASVGTQLQAEKMTSAKVQRRDLGRPAARQTDSGDTSHGAYVHGRSTKFDHDWDHYRT